jgi:hypothetical protein
MCFVSSKSFPAPQGVILSSCLTLSSRKVILSSVLTVYVTVATKKKAESMPDDLITLSEAADLRGVSVSTISHAVRRGRLQRFERYGKPLVSRSEVKSYQAQVGWPKGKARKTD